MTMKKLAALLLAAALSCAGAQAQTSAGEDAAERPDMPILFFTQEQRRILEAVRQGVVSSDTFEAEGFVPLVVIEETLPDETVAAEQRERQGFSVDALVRNRTKGTEYVWINGELVEVAQGSEVLEDSDVAVDEETKLVGADNVIRGIDERERSKFEMKVGQAFTKDGFISEELPVVVRHERN